ncbi:hypothetical protein FIBSPDRAFT_965416 [Athelia psychrophila]|uniref:Uncharacterized protein n=1 Tax=Athelia psychrophila TaxID=1759441 RepID=A0A165WK81_9AGAM|nr:hypothetical protein FIBSPDRAFT_965416 [Fibularhizoctonia sp. CBS 109695]
MGFLFYATDSDAKSLAYARANIVRNHLQRLWASPVEARCNGLDFTMWNPPFYSSEEDIAQSAAEKASIRMPMLRDYPRRGGRFVVRTAMHANARQDVLPERNRWPLTQNLGMISPQYIILPSNLMTRADRKLPEHTVRPNPPLGNRLVIRTCPFTRRSDSIEWWTTAESNARPEYLPLAFRFALPRAMLYERLVLALDRIGGRCRRPCRYRTALETQADQMACR